jgi:hypothetical protein
MKRRWLVTLISAALGTAAAQTPVPGAPQVITAPHYGDTLFHFYQGRSFAAITGLMVSQHFKRVSPHDDEAEVLRGGLLLGYGLHDEAEAVFARLIERQAPQEVQNRAWFYLAKLRHQRGLPEASAQALARVEGRLPGTLEEDHQLLRAQLLLDARDYRAAAAVLRALQPEAPKKDAPPPSTALLYARYNLGVALVKAGDEAEGQALLDSVGQTPGPDEEVRSLRDRANVALGFVALAAKKPRDARAVLQRVRLQGPQSNKALLGFGWAAAELKDPQLALAPWTELAGRGAQGGADAAVLEARIALPYAMAELRAYQSALQGYRQAAQGFEDEQRALTESIAAVRGGAFVQRLLDANPEGSAPGLGVSPGIGQLPPLPHAAHLAPLLAGHGFQEAFKQLRDLQFLQHNVQQWQNNLGTYADMLDNRRRAFEARLPAARNSRGAAELAALAERRSALVAELARTQAEGDVGAFANPAEQALQQRIERSRSTLKAAEGSEVMDAAALAEAAERLRRAAGALQWQLSQTYSERRWEATKALRGAEATLAEAREREAALVRAQQEEPARHALFAERITQLSGRIAALQPQLAGAAQLAQARLQDIAVAELQAQQERLGVYAAQARLAIAQIHDQAQFARRSDAAAPSPEGSPR